jgi:hypothetical protein
MRLEPIAPFPIRGGTALLVGLFLVTVTSFVAPISASESGPTLVLPFRAIGVSETTAAVVADLLSGELESRGILILPSRRAEVVLGAEVCDDPECANAAAASAGAARVVYGSLSRLGDKIILRVRALWVGERTPYFADQISAATEEDLDTVARRVADSIAAGRTDAAKPTIQTVTEEETFEPRRRASRSRFGLRAGFLFPDGSSFGDADRLTSLGLVITYETPKMLIKSTPLLALAWRGETVEWTPFDLFVARIFGIGDFCPYVGAGLGIASVHVEREYDPAVPYSSTTSGSESETTLAADLGVGILMLRTYDVLIDVELRYHYVFADFDGIGSDGAHGFGLRIGISR